MFWQGKKASNPRPTVLETAALPAELFPYTICFLNILWDRADTVRTPIYQNESEAIRFGKAEESRNMKPSPQRRKRNGLDFFLHGGPSGTRTPGRPVMSRLLYQLS